MIALREKRSGTGSAKAGAFTQPPMVDVAIGEAIEGELREQAEKRMKSGVSNPPENLPEGQQGATRDIAAKAAGANFHKLWRLSCS
jgi:hypothetical protein